MSARALGEAIRQVRYAIKDLMYRNRQERIAGELDLARQQLAILRDNSLLSDLQMDELIIELAPRTPLARVMRAAQPQLVDSDFRAALVERTGLPGAPPRLIGGGINRPDSERRSGRGGHG